MTSYDKPSARKKLKSRTSSPDTAIPGAKSNAGDDGGFMLAKGHEIGSPPPAYAFLSGRRDDALGTGRTATSAARRGGDDDGWGTGATLAGRHGGRFEHNGGDAPDITPYKGDGGEVEFATSGRYVGDDEGGRGNGNTFVKAPFDGATLSREYKGEGGYPTSGNGNVLVGTPFDGATREHKGEGGYPTSGNGNVLVRTPRGGGSGTGHGSSMAKRKQISPVAASVHEISDPAAFFKFLSARKDKRLVEDLVSEYREQGGDEERDEEVDEREDDCSKREVSEGRGGTKIVFDDAPAPSASKMLPQRGSRGALLLSKSDRIKRLREDQELTRKRHIVPHQNEQFLISNEQENKKEEIKEREAKVEAKTRNKERLEYALIEAKRAETEEKEGLEQAKGELEDLNEAYFVAMEKMKPGSWDFHKYNKHIEMVDKEEHAPIELVRIAAGVKDANDITLEMCEQFQLARFLLFDASINANIEFRNQIRKRPEFVRRYGENFEYIFDTKNQSAKERKKLLEMVLDV